MALAIVPWISTSLSSPVPARACKPSTFWVIRVSSLPPGLESDQRAMAVVGLAFGPHPAVDVALPRPLSGLRVADVGLDRGGFLGAGILGPDAVRPAEIGDARVGRDARSRQYADAVGVLDQRRRLLDRRHAHRA